MYSQGDTGRVPERGLKKMIWIVINGGCTPQELYQMQLGVVGTVMNTWIGIVMRRRVPSPGEQLRANKTRYIP